MSYRDDVAALEARVASLKNELAETEELAAEARRLVRQHVIEAELATPCTALWSEMKGDDRVRHCNQCDKNVYNFAELTRDEIDAVITKTEGTLCGRLFLRADGTVVTKDCARVQIRPSRLQLAVAGGTLAVAALLAGGAVAEQFAGPTSEDVAAEYSGAISVEPYDRPPDGTPTEGGRNESDYQGGVSFASQRPNN